MENSNQNLKVRGSTQKSYKYKSEYYKVRHTYKTIIEF